MNMKHNRQYINKLKLQNRIYSVILFFSLVGGVLYITKAPVISPCSQDGCFVKTVYAKEEKTELEQITQYIVEKFQPEGRGVATRALACFISESGLRTDAYNWNTNNTADVGVAQINDVHGLSVEARKDWKANLDKAYQIYKRRGWSAWYGKGCK